MASYVKFSKRLISLNALAYVKKPVFVGELPPKKPASPYALYVRDAFHRNGTIAGQQDATSRMKVLSQHWKSMDQEEKQNYIDEYNRLKTQYDSIKDSFIKSMSDDEKLKYEKYLKDRQKYTQIRKMKKAGSYNPYPRKLSGFQIYMKETMAQSHWLSSAEKKVGFVQASQDWKSLSNEEKTEFNDKAEKIHEERVTEYNQKFAAS